MFERLIILVLVQSPLDISNSQSVVLRVSFGFWDVQEFRRDCEIRERFDENLPGWENHIGGQREDVGDESRSFRGGLAGGPPRRLHEIERGGAGGGGGGG